MCSYQRVRNVNFSESPAYVLNGWPLVINLILSYSSFPTNIYLFKVNDRNSRISCGICWKLIKKSSERRLLKVNGRNRKRFEICSKLTIKTRERRHWHLSGFFIVNSEHISLFSSVSKVGFEQVNISWVIHGTITLVSKI